MSCTAASFSQSELHLVGVAEINVVPDQEHVARPDLAVVVALGDADILADSYALVDALCDADVLADSLALLEALTDVLVLVDSDLYTVSDTVSLCVYVVSGY